MPMLQPVEKSLHRAELLMMRLVCPRLQQQTSEQLPLKPPAQTIVTQHRRKSPRRKLMVELMLQAMEEEEIQRPWRWILRSRMPTQITQVERLVQSRQPKSGITRVIQMLHTILHLDETRHLRCLLKST
jgi:hypothetical protein